jgi:hypothetical protein
MCVEPSYGADQKRYKLFVDIFNEDATLDFFPNICRAKYKSDEKIRKALVDIDVSSYDIDHDDVTVIALKVLKEFARVQGRR